MTKIPDERKLQWERRYQQDNAAASVRVAADVVQSFQHLLPEEGDALDLACGVGANALFLAKLGLRVKAWDYSNSAIECVKENARNANVQIAAIVRDVVAQPPTPRTFDVIVVSNFLDRTIFPMIKAALRKNGLLFYQTFTLDRITEGGPSNEQFRLASNELLTLCRDLHLLAYREEGGVGDVKIGLRGLAYCVAQKLE